MSRYLVWTLIEPSPLHSVHRGARRRSLARCAPARWCRGACVLLIVALGLLPTAWALTRPLEQRFGFPPKLDRVDGVIVLAGAEWEG